MKKIGFIHVPKTGGLGLAEYWRSQGTVWCGKHQTLGTLMKHEHEHTYITFVRDPLQTYISFYYFVTRHHINLYKHHTPQDMPNMHLIWGEHGGLQEDGNPDMHVKGNAKVSLNEFLENCEPNQMFGHFFAPHGPEAIDFVGYTKEMDKSYDLLAKTTGIIAPKRWININPNKKLNEDYVVNIEIDAFKKRNELDYEMYHRGIERYNKLCKEYLT